MSRRGVTLVELLVALVLGAGLSVLILNAFAAAASRLRDRSERMGLSQSLRVAAEALRAGLEDLGADSTAGADLVDSSVDRVRYRATRFVGMVCDTATPNLIVRTGGAASARRLPQPGRDSALVLGVEEPERWHPAAVASGPGPAACPFGGQGLAIGLTLDSSQRAAIGPGSVVRIFETMEARRYASGGLSWLGLQSLSAGEVIQPLSGPLSPAAGLTVGPEQAGGGPALSPGTAAAVRLQIRAVTSRDFGVGIARTGAQAGDSMPAYVFLRNRP